MTAFLDQSYFEDLKKTALKALKKDEHLFLNLAAESSQFIRINKAKIRQTGVIEDGLLNLNFVASNSKNELRKTTRAFTLTGSSDQDKLKLLIAIDDLRHETLQLPIDPFAELPKRFSPSVSEKKGHLLGTSEAADALLTPAAGSDLVGLYSAGPVVRAIANSAGLTHWFKTENFLLDYSLYTPDQRAIKGLLAGSEWSQSNYIERLKSETSKLSLLERPSRKLSPGDYRVYLAPPAVSDLVAMFSWGCVSEAAIRQGDSPLRKMRESGKKFSSDFHLEENFSAGQVPRWNDEGELSQEVLPLIEAGALKSSLISNRTALEYKLTANAATAGEGMRAASVREGRLLKRDILKELETGLYISNLHYLNWSDQPEGRITGMTRYACFWVENSEIVCPIENMRFDDTIFRLFGTELSALTEEREWISETGTYGMRSLGAMRVPGALVSQMKFTL